MENMDLKKVQRRIKDRNRRFQKLSPAQKKVQIARDVLKHLDSRKLVARNGTYMRFERQDDYYTDVWIRASFDDAHPVECQIEARTDVRCQVCALGAVFTSTLLRTDGFDGDWIDANNDNNMRGYLKQYFSIAELWDIETAFENGDFNGSRASKEFGEKLDSMVSRWDEEKAADYRLRRIMWNIIDNGGRFRPEKEDWSDAERE